MGTEGSETVSKAQFDRTHAELTTLKNRIYQIADELLSHFGIPKNTEDLSSDNAIVTALKDNDRNEKLKSSYETLTHYDLHYSTVRSAISIFLIGLAIGVAQFALDKSSRRIDIIFMFLVLPLLILLFNFLLNKYFQSLTWACRLLQEWIEIELSGKKLNQRKDTITIPQNVIELFPRKKFSQLKNAVEDKCSEHIILFHLRKKISKKTGKGLRRWFNPSNWVWPLDLYFRCKIKQTALNGSFIDPTQPRAALDQTVKFSSRFTPIWYDYPLFYLTIAYICLGSYAYFTIITRLAPFDWEKEGWWQESPSTVLPAVAKDQTPTTTTKSAVPLPVEAHPVIIKQMTINNYNHNYPPSGP